MRTEPENLSFSEVWDDIAAFLGKRHDFVSVGDNTYNSRPKSLLAPTGVVLETLPGDSYLVTQESLLETWQCLRFPPASSPRTT